MFSHFIFQSHSQSHDVPLTLAAEWGHVETVLRLLGAGIFVNQRNKVDNESCVVLKFCSVVGQDIFAEIFAACMAITSFTSEFHNRLV